jgi:hypothetical protein
MVIFFFGYLIMKYQLFYVYVTKKETGGAWWPIVFGTICITICFFQLITFFSLASIGGATIPPTIYVTMQPVFTCFFYYICMSYLMPKCELLKAEDEDIISCEPLIIDPCFESKLPELWVYDHHIEELQEMESKLRLLGNEETIITESKQSQN